MAESSNGTKVGVATLREADLADLRDRMAASRGRVMDLLALEPRQIARLILADAVDDLNHAMRCLEGVDLEQQPHFLRIADRLLQSAEWRLALAEETALKRSR